MDKENNFDKIVPTGYDFRDKVLPQAFTWSEGIQRTPESGLYVVAFRSLRNLEAGRDKIQRLLDLDKEAFEEAKGMSGFRTYWHDDELDKKGRGLSFCVWDTLEDAKRSGSMPRHLDAVNYVMNEGSDVYLDYTVKGQHLFKVEDEIIFVS